MTGQERGAPGLMVQFLAWVAARPRTYTETMDAWPTSYPRFSVWEDALGDGRVAQDADFCTTQGIARVCLTPLGRARLQS